MITLIEAKNYRCLHYIKQHLEPFQVLVGPNASGKTTFLDVVSFIGDFVSEGPIAAISKRTKNFGEKTGGLPAVPFSDGIRTSQNDHNTVKVERHIGHCQ